MADMNKAEELEKFRQNNITESRMLIHSCYYFTYIIVTVDVTMTMAMAIVLITTITNTITIAVVTVL